ncbi:MAG: phosphoglucosamine mutase [Elusimicrobiota bacterium]
MSHHEALFGTDGIRGIPGKPPLMPETISAVAAICAKLLRARAPSNGSGAPKILIARDTRGSGPKLVKTLTAGFASAGCRAIDLGVAPTPAVAYLTPKLKALAGVVVSASHNPAQFNGIKFFTSDGLKMDPATESQVERELARGRRAPAKPPRGPLALQGGASQVRGYIDFLRSTFPATLDLSGMRLVVDCAQGAAYGIAPALFRALGAEVFALGCSPDGRNINSGCGALFPAAMQKAVLRHRAHAGICFDGDADRCLFADEKGALIDGDALICLSAMYLKRQGLLLGDKVVLTVMSNYGCLKYLESHGVSVVSVPVGDRNVTEAIEKEGLSIGGEASGHIIFREFAATGDGMLTALQTLAAVRAQGLPLSAHRKSFRATPQIIKNVKVVRKPPLQGLPRTKALIERCARGLGGGGRVFVRYSGTEPLLRIMVEGPSLPAISRMARELATGYLLETGQEVFK